MTRDERQQLAKKKWFEHKGIGTLVMPTGTGKTRTALLCLRSIVSKYPQTRFLVIVPTDNLKEQWETQLVEWNLSMNGIVVVVNTAIKHEYNVDIMVIDECHRVSSTTFRQIFTTVKYKHVLGLTATFERLDGLHKEVMEKYCPVIDTISLTEALANKWISEFKEYQVLIDVDDIDEYLSWNKSFTEHFEYFGSMAPDYRNIV